jgi:hypothetical protein
MNSADAARELYLYSDSLPDNITTKDLELIASGQCQGKCPAQLQAAAQYMLDNPEEFAKLAPEGSISRGGLEDNCLAMIEFDQSEVNTINTLCSNQGQFLGDDGVITRDSLAELAADESAPAEVRAAAQELLDNPMLFGMLDNGTLGHEGSRKNKTHDGKIDGQDIISFVDKLQPGQMKPREAPKPQEAKAPTTDIEKAALADMEAGWADDPAIKESRGGRTGLKKFLEVVSKVLTAVTTALDVVAGFLPPPFGAAVAGISAGVSAVKNFGVKAGMAMLDGVPPKDAMKQAAKDQAWDTAGSLASAIPGGGAAVKGAVMGAKVAVKEGVEAGVKQGIKEGLETGAKQGLQEGLQTGAKQGLQDTMQAGARETAENRGRDALAETGEAAGRKGSGQTGRNAGEEAAEEVADEVAEEGLMASLKTEAKDTVTEIVQEEATLFVQTKITEATGYEFGASSGDGDGGVGGRRGRRGRGDDADMDAGSGKRQTAEPPSRADGRRADADGGKDKAANKSDPKADKTDKNDDKDAERARREKDAAQQQDTAAGATPPQSAALDLMLLQAMMITNDTMTRSLNAMKQGPAQADKRANSTPAE